MMRDAPIQEGMRSTKEQEKEEKWNGKETYRKKIDWMLRWTR
jgi:hypothetical protein